MFHISWERLGTYGPRWANFPRKGHVVEVPLTDEDRAAHARAEAAFAELESNPWVMPGYEPDDLRPLEPRTKFVPEETEEEWLERWVEAGRPVRDLMAELGDTLIRRAQDAYTKGGFVARHTDLKDWETE